MDIKKENQRDKENQRNRSPELAFDFRFQS